MGSLRIRKDKKMINEWNTGFKTTGSDGDVTAISYHEYVCDAASDVANLPDATEVLPGSLAYVIAEKKMYIMDSTGSWTATE